MHSQIPTVNTNIFVCNLFALGEFSNLSGFLSSFTAGLTEVNGGGGGGSCALF